ncbi:hypothetical protein J4E08_24105 [Sagittula sp. NFXS13]|uniref:hypothetical protein n=1 Tax=Sagittula sp. NFXS13 TaxID=2819095 RepID=UPI0032DEDEBC
MAKKTKTETSAVDSFACNEARLLTAMLAYQVMHVARLVISARRMTLILAEASAPFWAAIWPQI